MVGLLFQMKSAVLAGALNAASSRRFPFYQASQPLNLNMDWVHSLMFALTAVELLCFFGAYRAKKVGWESLWILGQSIRRFVW